MGKSIKKTPIIKSSGPKHKKFAKREANRKVRRSKHIPNGKQYRKYYNPWDISDDVCRYSIYEHLAYYESELNAFYNNALQRYRVYTEEEIHESYDINQYLKSMYRK